LQPLSASTVPNGHRVASQHQPPGELRCQCRKGDVGAARPLGLERGDAVGGDPLQCAALKRRRAAVRTSASLRRYRGLSRLGTTSDQYDQPRRT